MEDEKLNIMGNAKKWLYVLFGKTPLVSVSNMAEKVASKDLQKPQEIQEDSVAGDIRMLKNLIAKIIEKIGIVIAPYTKKGISVVGGVTGNVSLPVDSKFIKTLVRIFLIALFAIVLIFIAVYLFNTLKKEYQIDQATTINVTPAPFDPGRASVYAQDPEVLKLEEDINILERELNRINIKEEDVSLPGLDWNISF